MFIINEGVAHITDALLLFIRSQSISGLCISSSFAIQAVIPLQSGIKLSIIDTSNEIAAIPSITPPGYTRFFVSSFLSLASTKLQRLPCSIITPFGLPVEPEVYMQYASDDAGISRFRLLSFSCFIRLSTVSTLYRLSSENSSGLSAFIFSVVMTNGQFASVRQKSILSSGYSLAIGKNAPPAFKIPYSQM